MKIFKRTVVVKKKTDKIICNGCGRELDPYTDFLCISKKWGYGSKYDGQKHSLDLCPDCYEKLLSDLKIPPVKDV